jgi:hypothetical protein
MMFTRTVMMTVVTFSFNEAGDDDREALILLSS